MNGNGDRVARKTNFTDTKSLVNLHYFVPRGFPSNSITQTWISSSEQRFVDL